MAKNPEEIEKILEETAKILKEILREMEKTQHQAGKANKPQVLVAQGKAGAPFLGQDHSCLPPAPPGFSAILWGAAGGHLQHW